MKSRLLFSLALTSITAIAQNSSTDYQKRAIELYPEIAKAGSVQNKRFLDAVATAKNQRPELFKSPEWPLTIAREIGGETESKRDLSNGIPGLSDQNTPRTSTAPSPDAASVLEFGIQSQNISEV